MEIDNWIENIIDSTNGITQVIPSNDLLLKIQQKIKQEKKVSSKTVWLVAASIAVLILINVSVLKTKVKDKTQSATIYLETTLNQSNQLYQ